MGNAWTDERARTTLREIFDAAIGSAAPDAAIRRHLPEKPKGRCIVVGAGKASAAMAAALDAAWADVALSGVVATRYGHAVPALRIRIIEAGHPVPDVESERAARTMLHAVSDLRSDDLVIALISGGGSALLALPAGDMSLADKPTINKALLLSGAAIGEMNGVRKHLSAIKGGRLAAAAKPARSVTLVISDVPGDDPGIIASGPTVPDVSALADVAEIVMRFRLALPASAKALLATGSEVVSPPESRTAGGAIGKPCVRTDRAMPAIIVPSSLDSPSSASPAVANQAQPGIWALAGDSNGIDGTEDAAGAIVTPDTLARGRAAGLDARRYLTAHDSYSYFDALGDLVRTGPTLTNVNDIRAILIS